MIKIKKILVPTDLREQSLAGIKYAISLAREHGAEMFVLHVVGEEQTTKASMVPPEGQMFFPREWASVGVLSRPFIDIELEERKLHSFIYGHFEAQELRPVKVTLLVELGDVAEGIVSTATEQRCDLIIMASQGKGWLARMISGSMSEEVARKAPCPVLTIQPSAVVQDNGRWIQARSLVEKDVGSHA